MISLVSVYLASDKKREIDFSKELSEEQERWSRATSALDESVLLIEIVCDRDLIASFMNFRSSAFRIVVRLAEAKEDVYTESKDKYLALLCSARAAIRSELGIDPQTKA